MSHTPTALDSVHAQHRFFVGLSGLFLALAIVGFAPSFFLKVVFENPGAIVEQAEILRRDAGGDGLSAAYFRRRPETHKYLMLLATMSLVPVPNARIWGWSGVENALEFWLPLTENGLLVLIIGSDWLIRRRTPWVLLGGFAVIFLLYGVMYGLGSTQTAQSWALGWMI